MSSMDFIVFQIGTPDDLTKKEEQFFTFLRNYPRQREERNLHFCITTDITLQNSIITGNLSQEHLPLSSPVNENKEYYAPNDSPYLHTLFSLDLQKRFLLLQYRDYPPANLDKDLTRNRLTRVLNEGFNTVYKQQFNPIPTEKPYDDSELIELFNKYRVSELRVKIGDSGRLLRDSSSIFEDANYNKVWIEAWNEDTSNISEVILKSPGRGGDGDLRLSPLAQTLLQIPSKEIEQIIYWDEDGKQNKVSKRGYERFKINDIDIHTYPITAVEVITTQISQRRNEFSQFNRINLG
ncbi:hypothetical protein [Paenibacillus popilliae]|uniref:Zn-dependent hydrolase n=1 Tax=Paenibacillus popilliae ATCC 14706 TaxID=1212764 RepID=M9LQB7_PAEPP|nr:hypothetical protein [Paenibacillus popilliae]GAC43006.1 Zn-dependent hydrolase [Paenibacillus popilliae ATCC 14706]